MRLVREPAVVLTLPGRFPLQLYEECMAYRTVKLEGGPYDGEQHQVTDDAVGCLVERDDKPPAYYLKGGDGPWRQCSENAYFAAKDRATVRSLRDA